ncbi:MAG: SGNH/GDSL hydrolase family protein [Deltaproteobacteria bacterium]|nr:SGNH/GDSL hydrolase family protein [Deltaproteobacteria bacterium]
MLLLFTLACGQAEGRTCVPPLFEEGLRLHDLDGANLFDLDLIFRQHEICRRPELHPSERTVALIGNSAVFGLYVAAAESFAGILNERWSSSNAPLHVYNLGFVTTYQFKDALIVRQALDYEPDLIVYGISLADFVHLAPIPWPDTLPRFFAANDAAIDRLSEEGAAGLEHLVATYRARPQYKDRLGQRWTRFRESGAYLRLGVRQNAPKLVNRWLLSPGDGPVGAPAASGKIRQAGPDYRCQKVLDAFGKSYGEEWSSWNVLAYLEQIARERGVDVVVVDLPSQHDPKDECYNARQPASADLAYRHWLREQASSRDLELWDLHDLLPRSQFEDSVHPTESGHRKIAETLAGRIQARLAESPDHAVSGESHAALNAPGPSE